MKLLLDTHAFLWYISADPRLPPRCKDAIEDLSNEVFLSVASMWEVVIKHQSGKLPLPQPVVDYLIRERNRHSIEKLTIEEETLHFLVKLPLLHRDPFDRILVAQAIQNGMTIVTVDAAVIAYPVPTLS